jgi:uncharacterized damage-inducible protein DinB
MSATDSATGASLGASLGATRAALLASFRQETATTLRVLRAFPDAESEMRPHPRAKNARELAWVFSLDMMLASMAIKGELEITGEMPPAPETLGATIDSFDQASTEFLQLLADSSDEQLASTVQFPSGPGQMGEFPVPDFLWFALHDQIHHRGQFSVYLRMSGGKVPSIYGPSADEPWF